MENQKFPTANKNYQILKLLQVGPRPFSSKRSLEHGLDLTLPLGCSKVLGMDILISAQICSCHSSWQNWGFSLFS